LAALASGASFRYGPSHKDSWPAINFEMRSGADGPRGYRGDRLLRAAPFLGFGTEEMNPRWPLPMDKVRQMAQQVHFHKPNPDQMLIGVDPGVSKAGHAFALENIQFLVRQLASQLVCKILPLGDPDQEERLQKFETRLSEVPVGLERETLLEMILLLSHCDLFVGGNTDFFHFAVSLGVPAVGLFSKVDGPEWEPTDRPAARVIRVTKGEKVDIETLMEAVEAVTGGRTSTASRVIQASASKPSHTDD
jgi:ADP-heptose:LPS heptosyltransferase